ncbi:ATP-dependent DNA helicase Rep [Salinisphaera sp. PC39]|uniref:UvrD-helicase domain-containing protein n=1 Tax=Salinisphaera sp. PC39 TaxID=1304156 RepID=UPI00333EDCE9
MAATPKLNPQQRAAVRHLDGPLLVLAGAGSGKTGVITHKIAHLAASGFAPSRIAAVTFTNKAAREMKTRVSALMGAREAAGLQVSTFHSLGLRLLREEHRAVGLKPGFSIFDAEDSDKLLAELLGRDAELRKAARFAISNWKSALVSPEAAMAGAEDEATSRAARAYGEYQRHLSAYNAVDFDDLLYRPVRLLAEDREARERWQSRFGYILVDEYQDTNGAQYELLKLLTGPRAAFTVVGDDDQSIYAWRGARPGNLSQLSRDFPHLQVIKLEQNYRSCGYILNAANRLIEGNERVFDKTLWSALGPGERLRVLPCADEAGEAERVVSELLSHRVRTGNDLGAYAVLYRSNHQSRPIERVLRERGIGYRVSGGRSFFERAEVRDLVGYLRLLVNPDDDAAFLRVINLPRREIGPATLEQLGRYAGERGLSLFDAARGIGLAGRLPDRSGRRLMEFTEWAGGLMRRGESEPAGAVLRQLIADIGYRDWLRETAANPKAAQRRLENVDELEAWLARSGEDDTGKPRDLHEVVAQLGLLNILDQRDDTPDRDKVHLLTLHAAKGLEFDHVYLVGAEEGLLPHANSVADDNLEEERRLLYVGITRARKSLSLTFCRQRQRQGSAVDCAPSRFLEELPADELEWEGRSGTGAQPENARERGRAHLAGLKALLNEG